MCNSHGDTAYPIWCRDLGSEGITSGGSWDDEQMRNKDIRKELKVVDLRKKLDILFKKVEWDVTARSRESRKTNLWDEQQSAGEWEEREHNGESVGWILFGMIESGGSGQSSW
jgi:hypothetical protein